MALATRDIQYIIKAKDEASKEFKKLSKNIEETSRVARKAGIALTAVGTAGAFAVKKLGGAAGELQQTTRAFESLIGNAETAQRLLGDLANFAAKTPFTLKGVRDSAKRLLAFGFSAEEVLPTLKAIGDASAAVGLDDEGFQRLIFNLGQVRAKGKLTGVEIRDFANNAIPLIDQLAETMGVAKQEVLKLSEEGKISADVVMQAFHDMTSEGGRFANFMDKNAGTLPQVWSNVGDALDILKEKLGKSLVGPLTDLGELIVRIANGVSDFVEQNPKVAEFAAKVLLIGTAFSLLAGPILVVLGMVPMVIAGFGAIATMAGAMWIAITGPIGLAVLAIGIVVAAVVVFKDKWIAMFMAIAEFTGRIWAGIKSTFAEAWEGIREIFAKGAEIVTTAWSTFLDTLESALSAPVEKIRETFDGLFSWISDKLAGLIDFTLQVVERVKEAVGLTRSTGPTDGPTPIVPGRIVSRAIGGVVNEPFTRVGENGPEVVALPRGSQVYSNQRSKGLGGVNVTLHIHGSMIGLGREDIVDALGEQVMKVLNPMIAHA